VSTGREIAGEFGEAPPVKGERRKPVFFSPVFPELKKTIKFFQAGKAYFTLAQPGRKSPQPPDPPGLSGEMPPFYRDFPLANPGQKAVLPPLGRFSPGFA